MNDELPQGFVLVSALFNLYVSDLSTTRDTKFRFIDDNAIAYMNRISM